MRHNGAPEDREFVRAKRHVNNLPNSWNDLHKCDDKDTDRQIRRSRNNFRESIRYLRDED